MFRKYLHLTCLVLLSFSACNGLDNDTQFETATRSSFFLGTNNSDGNTTLIRTDGETLFPDWQLGFGVSSTSLSDFSLKETQGLICDPEDRELLVIDMQNESIERTIAFSTIAIIDFIPHFAEQGDKFIFVSDSINSKIAFIKLKKSGYESFFFDVDLPPRDLIFNGGKFYVQLGCCDLAIYHELANAEVARFSFEYPLSSFAVDGISNVRAITLDTAGISYLSIIDANGDNLVTTESPTFFSKLRYSPWTSKVYGTEYLEDIYRTTVLINAPGHTVTDSVWGFEPDFFEGILYYQWRDSITKYDLNSTEVLWRMHYPYSLDKGFHYIDIE